MNHDITFARLPRIAPREIIAHMSDPRVAEHMSLLTFEWDVATVVNFIATKEELDVDCYVEGLALASDRAPSAVVV